MQNKTIFIVEDDPSYSAALKTLIERKTDYNCRIFSDGMDCLEELNNVSPHLLLVDYYLPGLNGKQFCELAKAKTSGKIIFITGSNFQSRQHLVLRKPFSSKAILRYIVSVLG